MPLEAARSTNVSRRRRRSACIRGCSGRGRASGDAYSGQPSAHNGHVGRIGKTFGTDGLPLRSGIKDMAGLLKPYVAYEIVSRLKETVRIPVRVALSRHHGDEHRRDRQGVGGRTPDYADTSISSMSIIWAFATESIVTILEGTQLDTGLNLQAIEEIAAYFAAVRQKYAKFEGALKGIDSRILVAQVPGGMFSNMENQLREQGAAGKIDQVLAEISRVREGSGLLPLVTPTYKSSERRPVRTSDESNATRSSARKPQRCCEAVWRDACAC